MALCQTSVLKLYHTVIEDVISSVRDAFLDEGVDEQVLQEMKQIWRTKLLASKAVEANPEPPELQPPSIVANNPKISKAAAAKSKKAAAAAAAAAQRETNAGGGTITSNSAIITTSNTFGDTKSSNINSIGSTTGTGTVIGAGIKMNNSGGGGIVISGSGASGSSGPILNGTTTIATVSPAIKQEPIISSHPPPLQPTSHHNLLHQQQQLQHQQQVIKQANSQIISSGQQQQQHQTTSAAPPATIPVAVAALDPNKIMPVNITLPAQPAQPGAVKQESRVITIHVPASALQENQLTQILTAHLISSIMSLPTPMASSVLQQHVNSALQNANIQKTFGVTKQLDGAVDTSDDEESEESDENMENDDDDDIDKEEDEDGENDGGAEEEPLNSEDDVTDEDASDLFDTDNVIVCQYDKITRSRNKWKFYLKDGIMNIGGKDYVFQKSNGDAEW